MEDNRERKVIKPQIPMYEDTAHRFLAILYILKKGLYECKPEELENMNISAEYLKYLLDHLYTPSLDVPKGKIVRERKTSDPEDYTERYKEDYAYVDYEKIPEYKVVSTFIDKSRKIKTLLKEQLHPKNRIKLLDDDLTYEYVIKKFKWFITEIILYDEPLIVPIPPDDLLENAARSIQVWSSDYVPGDYGITYLGMLYDKDFYHHRKKDNHEEERKHLGFVCRKIISNHRNLNQNPRIAFTLTGFIAHFWGIYPSKDKYLTMYNSKKSWRDYLADSVQKRLPYEYLVEYLPDLKEYQ